MYNGSISGSDRLSKLFNLWRFVKGTSPTPENIIIKTRSRELIYQYIIHGYSLTHNYLFYKVW